jgi:hypothetical protein
MSGHITQLFTIGAPGTGKSRFIAELNEKVPVFWFGTVRFVLVVDIHADQAFRDVVREKREADVLNVVVFDRDEMLHSAVVRRRGPTAPASPCTANELSAAGRDVHLATVAQLQQLRRSCQNRTLVVMSGVNGGRGARAAWASALSPDASIFVSFELARPEDRAVLIQRAETRVDHPTLDPANAATVINMLLDKVIQSPADTECGRVFRLNPLLAPDSEQYQAAITNLCRAVVGGSADC